MFGITCLTDKGLFRIPVQASLEPGVLFFPLQLEARKLKKPPDSQRAHPNWIIRSGGRGRLKLEVSDHLILLAV